MNTPVGLIDKLTRPTANAVGPLDNRLLKSIVPVDGGERVPIHANDHKVMIATIGARYSDVPGSEGFRDVRIVAQDEVFFRVFALVGQGPIELPFPALQLYARHMICVGHKSPHQDTISMVFRSFAVCFRSVHIPFRWYISQAFWLKFRHFSAPGAPAI